MGRTSAASRRVESSSRSNRPLHQHQRVGLDERGRLRERLGEHHDLDRAVRVVEHEGRHAVALARLELADRRDDAADGDVFADAPGGPPRRLAASSSSAASALPGPPAGPRGSSRRTPRGPPCGGRSDGRSGRGRAPPSRTPGAAPRSTAAPAAAAGRRCASPSSVRAAEQLRLALVAVALVPVAVVDGAVEGGDQPRPELAPAPRPAPASPATSESSAPPLIRLSSTRLFTRRRSTSSHRR